MFEAVKKKLQEKISVTARSDATVAVKFLRGVYREENFVALRD
jgi:hypothetical protein